MNRELDAACARAIGYRPCACSDEACDLWAPPTHLDDGGSYKPFPRFSSDPTAARLLEDAIERRGLQERYIEALYPLVNAWQFGMSTSEQWNILRATPEQRARAFLETIS